MVQTMYEVIREAVEKYQFNDPITNRSYTVRDIFLVDREVKAVIDGKPISLDLEDCLDDEVVGEKE